MARGDLIVVEGIYSCSAGYEGIKYGTVKSEFSETDVWNAEFSSVTITSRIGDTILLSDVDALEGLCTALGNVLRNAKAGLAIKDAAAMAVSLQD